MPDDESLEAHSQRLADMNWQSTQYHASTHAAYARPKLLVKVLAAARAGDLALDWRAHLDMGYSSTAQIYSDCDELAMHEIATMPPQLWEPYVAQGDWRAALNAWHTASLELEEYVEALRTRPAPSLAVAAGISFTSPAGGPLGQHVRALLADMRTASYQAGLAAGGDDVDWQAWLRSREGAYPAKKGPTDWGRLRQALEQLPDYWTKPQPTA
jgi:hypothetical protein